MTARPAYLAVCFTALVLSSCAGDRLIAPHGGAQGVPALDRLSVALVKFDLADFAPPGIVRVHNTGDGALGTVEVQSIRYSAQRTDWLQADIVNAPSGDSATVTLWAEYRDSVHDTPDTAWVVLAAAGTDSTRTLTVTAQILPGAVLSPSVTELTFVTDTAATDTVVAVLGVSNRGNGGLEPLSLRASVVDSVPWLRVTAGRSYGMFDVQALPQGLPAGTYRSFVRVSSSQARQPDSVPVTLTIGNPSFSLPFRVDFEGDPINGVTFPVEGRENISILNQGSGTLGTLRLLPTIYEEGQTENWLQTTLTGSTLTLQPTVGQLEPRDHFASVIVAVGVGSTILAETTTVAFTVNSVTPSQLVLGTRRMDIPISASGSDVVYGYNGGGGPMPNFGSAEVSIISQPGVPADWLYVDAGTDLRGIFVNYGPVTPAPLSTISVKVEVRLDAMVDTLVIHRTVPFGGPALEVQGLERSASAATFGLYHNDPRLPAPKSATVASAGAADSIRIGLVNYGGSADTGWVSITPQGTLAAPAALTIAVNQRAMSLARGRYEAIVPLTSTLGGSANLNVALSVMDAPRISLSPREISWSGAEGVQQERFINTDNIGGGRLEGFPNSTTVTTGPIVFEGAETGWLGGGADQTSGVRTYTLLTLPPGTYRAKMPITLKTDPVTAAPSATDTVRVTWIVTAPPKPAILRLGAQTVSLAGQVGLPNHSEFEVAVFNSGSGDLGSISLGPIQYDVEGVDWLTASVTDLGIRLDAAPAGLAPDVDYRAVVEVRASGADAAVRLNVVYRVTRRSQAFATPVIALLPDTLRMTASQSSIRSGVTGTVGIADSIGTTIALAGLQVDSVEYAGERKGWIVGAFLARTTAPTGLAVVMKSKDLPAGTHTASIRLRSSSPGVAPRRLPIGLIVEP